MVVYKSARQTNSTAQLFARWRARLQRYAAGDLACHTQVVTLWIDVGALEAGIADALCPERDTDCRAVRACRQMSLLLGHLLVLSWTRQTAAIRPWLAGLQRTLAALLQAAGGAMASSAVDGRRLPHEWLHT